jgi:hypothetical protein
MYAACTHSETGASVTGVAEAQELDGDDCDGSEESYDWMTLQQLEQSSTCSSTLFKDKAIFHRTERQIALTAVTGICESPHWTEVAMFI